MRHLFKVACVFILVAGCQPGKDDENKDKSKVATVEDPTAAPTPSPAPNVPVVPAGTLAIGDYSALAIGQATGVNLLQGSGKYLASVGLDGKVAKIDLPATKDYAPGESDEPQVKELINIGQHGILVVFNDMRYNRHTNALLIEADGTLTAFAPETDESAQFFLANAFVDSTDQITFLGGFGTAQNLWRFEPATRQFSQLTDKNLIVNDFVVTADGSTYLYGISTNLSPYLRRMTSTLGFEEIEESSSISSAGAPFGRFMFSFNRIHEVVDDVVLYRYAPRALDFRKQNAFGTSLTPPIIGGKWFVGTFETSDISRRAQALNVLTGKSSENPFTTSYLHGAGSARRVRFDYGGELFDGANLSKLSFAASTLSLSFDTAITHVGGPPLSVVRLFGPVQGFTEVYPGIARIKENAWYIEVDPATGLIDPNSRKLLSVDGVTLDNLFNYLTFYNVGDKTITVLGNDATPRLGELDLSGAAATIDPLTSDHLTGSADMANAHEGIVYGGSLYLPEDAGILQRDAAGTETPLDIPQLTGELDDPGCLRKYISIAATTATGGKPIVAMQKCNSVGNLLSTATTLVSFTDWTFGTIEHEFDLANVVGTSLTFDDSDNLILFDSAAKQLHVITYDATDGIEKDSTLSSVSLSLEGNVTTASQFGPSSDLQAIHPWSGNSFLAAGLTTAQTYKAYRIDLDDASETELSELSGVQVFVVAKGKQDILLIGGTKLATNKSVLYRYDVDGTYLGGDEESNIQILKIAELPEK